MMREAPLAPRAVKRVVDLLRILIALPILLRRLDEIRLLTVSLRSHRHVTEDAQVAHEEKVSRALGAVWFSQNRGHRIVPGILALPCHHAVFRRHHVGEDPRPVFVRRRKAERLEVLRKRGRVPEGEASLLVKVPFDFRFGVSHIYAFPDLYDPKELILIAGKKPYSLY